MRKLGKFQQEIFDYICKEKKTRIVDLTARFSPWVFAGRYGYSAASKVIAVINRLEVLGLIRTENRGRMDAMVYAIDEKK